MPTRNVNLNDHFDSFINTTVTSGRFSNASEVVRAALYLLEREEEEYQAKLKWLRGAVQEGIDAVAQGDYTILNTPDDIRKHVSGLRARK